MKKFLWFLDNFEENFIALLIFTATTIIFLAVVHRYTSGISFLWPYIHHIHMSWAQELCIILFVWMAKFGAAYGVRTGIHVGVDVVVKNVNPHKQKIMVGFSLLAGALFTAIIGTLGANFVYGLSFSDQTTPDLELPSWIVYLAIPLGSYLMCFRFLQVFYNYIVLKQPLPSHNHSYVEGLEEELQKS